MILRTASSTPTDTLFPYTTLFRSLPLHLHQRAEAGRVLDAVMRPEAEEPRHLRIAVITPVHRLGVVDPQPAQHRGAEVQAFRKRHGARDRKSTRLNSSH